MTQSTLSSFDNVLKNFGISDEFIQSYKNCIKSINFTIDSQKFNNNEGFEIWKNKNLPNAGAAIHAIAFEAYKGGSAAMLEILQSPEMVEVIARKLAGEEADNVNNNWQGWHQYLEQAKKVVQAIVERMR